MEEDAAPRGLNGYLVSILQELAGNQTEGAPVLILGFEEPELYQHPPQAMHMALLLVDLTEGPSANTQVIATTHSPYFVSGKGFESIRMIRKVGKSRETKAGHLTFEKLGAKLSEALGEKPSPPSRLMASVEQIMQPSQRELFFTAVPILVEGLEDIALISTHLHIIKRWAEFRAMGCHFVTASGKTNMSRLLGIAKLLEIPSFTVFDGDTDQTKKEEDVNRNRKDNSCLLRLCGCPKADPLSNKDVWGDDFVMWSTNIGITVREESGIGFAAWGKARDEARKEHGLEGVSKKNGILLTATVEGLKRAGLRSKTLDRLCDAILKHASKSAGRSKGEDGK